MEEERRSFFSSVSSVMIFADMLVLKAKFTYFFVASERVQLAEYSLNN